MSLIFMDGFDDGLAALGKWSFVSNNTVTSGGRTGNRAMLQDNSDTVLRRTVNSPDEHATFVVGFAFMLGSSYAASQILMFHSDAVATLHIMVGVDNNNAIVVRRGDSTVLGTSANNTLIPGIFQHVEAKVVLGDSPNGAVTIRVNGIAVLTLTAIDTKNAGTKTVLESVTFQASSGPAGTVFYLDDVYICNGAGSVNNDFLGDCSVQTLLPSGDGNYSQWVGSDGNSTNNSLLVDENPPNTTDYVESSVSGDKDTYAFTDGPTTGTIMGIAHRSYAAKSDSGVRLMRQTVRISGTDYPGSDIGLGTTYQNYARFLETSPATSTTWTTTELNAAEFGIECR